MFVYTSAKNGKGIADMFNSVAEEVLKNTETKSKKDKLRKSNAKKKACC